MFESCSSALEGILVKNAEEDCLDLPDECSKFSSVVASALRSCEVSFTSNCIEYEKCAASQTDRHFSLSQLKQLFKLVCKFLGLRNNCKKACNINGQVFCRAVCETEHFLQHPSKQDERNL